MSSAILDPGDLDRALHRRGDPMSRAAFLEVLTEVIGRPVDPLTAGEQDFLRDHAGMADDDLSDRRRAETRLELARARLALDGEAVEDAFSTAEVAGLLGRAEANIRRSRIAGDLYALNPGDAAGLRFPRWQFTERGTVVPGLRRIIPMFGRDAHPIAIGRFMTQAREELEGMTTVRWLAGGGSIDVVVDLVDDLGYL